MSHLVNAILCGNYEDYERLDVTSCALKHWPDLWPAEAAVDYRICEELKAMPMPTKKKSRREEFVEKALLSIVNKEHEEVLMETEDEDGNRRLVYKINANTIEL